jgi:hypothetical protein
MMVINTMLLTKQNPVRPKYDIELPGAQSYSGQELRLAEVNALWTRAHREVQIYL